MVLWDDSCRDIEGVIDVLNYDERFNDVVAEASKNYYLPDDNGQALWQREEIELEDYVLQLAAKHGYQCKKHPWVTAEV